MIILSIKDLLERKIINYNGLTFTDITHEQLVEDYPVAMELMSKIEYAVTGDMEIFVWDVTFSLPTETFQMLAAINANPNYLTVRASLSQYYKVFTNIYHSYAMHYEPDVKGAGIISYLNDKELFKEYNKIFGETPEAKEVRNKIKEIFEPKSTENK